MREAKTLLDPVRHEAVAALLREAVAAASRTLDAGREDPGLPPDDLVLPRISDPALVRAMGGALGLLATILQREGLVTVEELGTALGIYAAITAETAPEDGVILAGWAGTVREMAPALDRPHH